MKLLVKHTERHDIKNTELAAYTTSQLQRTDFRVDMIFQTYDPALCTSNTGGIQASSCFIPWRF